MTHFTTVLALCSILRYLDNTCLISMIEGAFGYLGHSGKGESISEIARQFIAFA